MDILKLLHERLSTETTWILAVLHNENRFIAKEELWQLVNKYYTEKTGDTSLLIKSRHFLDNFMNRLEGAALVDLQKVGQVRLYRLNSLGEAVLTYKSLINQ